MKNYKFLLIFPLIMVVIIIFFFYRMGRNDEKALLDFPLAYTNYEQAISDFFKAVLTSNPESAPATDEFERKADEALVLLKTKASQRISSLTKNDGDLMKVSLEIADLAGKEFDTLKAYQIAVSTMNTDLEQLAREFRDLTNQRQAAYSRYLELAGQNN